MPLSEREQKNRRLLAQYGMTIEEYENKLKQQGYKCAICGIHQDTLGYKLYVDHNHRTREIRDLLCTKCNSATGWLEGHGNLMKKCQEYLDRHNK
jgi:hypothetical protein